MSFMVLSQGLQAVSNIGGNRWQSKTKFSFCFHLTLVMPLPSYTIFSMENLLIFMSLKGENFLKENVTLSKKGILINIMEKCLSFSFLWYWSWSKLKASFSNFHPKKIISTSWEIFSQQTKENYEYSFGRNTTRNPFVPWRFVFKVSNGSNLSHRQQRTW